jgi:hypothetical protein
MQRSVVVLGVDPGIKNLAYAVARFKVNGQGLVEMDEHVCSSNRTLVSGRYKLGRARKKLERFWDNMDATMGIQVVAIEKQCKLRLINLQNAIKHSLKVLLPHAVFITVHPSSVKRMFDISTGSHRSNKAAAVNFGVSQGWIVHFQGAKKLDDYCDSLLTAFNAACQVLNRDPHIISHGNRMDDGRHVIRDGAVDHNDGFARLLDEVNLQLSKINISADGGGHTASG